MSTTYKIITFDQARLWHYANESALATGCMDLLHIGHLSLLEFAAGLKRGHSTRPVMVGINSDRAIKALKGKNRPINDEHTRCRMLAALACVSRVFIIDDTRVTNALAQIKPACWVKGGDYKLDTLDDQERETAQSLGIQILFAPLVPDVSTTKILGQQAHWEKP